MGEHNARDALGDRLDEIDGIALDGAHDLFRELAVVDRAIEVVGATRVGEREKHCDIDHKDLTRAHLRGMVNSIVFRDDADPVEFLEAMGDLDGGSEALADYFSDQWSRIEAFARTGTFDAMEDHGEMLSQTALLATAYARPQLEQDEVADQDWMELAWILRYKLPDLFIEMLMVLRAKASAFEAAFESDEAVEEDDGKVETGDTDRGQATPAKRDSDEESAI